MKTNETKILTPISVNYSKVTNVALTDAKLSGDALRLLILITNNDNNWNLNITYFTDKLGWSQSKRSRMITQLIDAGYLTMTKFSKGYGNGFGYSFEIEPYAEQTEQPIKNEPVPYQNLEEEESFIPNEEDNVKSIYNNNNSDLESLLANSNTNNDEDDDESDNETETIEDFKTRIIKLFPDKKINNEELDKYIKLLYSDYSGRTNDYIRKSILSGSYSTFIFENNTVTEPQLEYN